MENKIYLTQEGKEEIEAKIADYERSEVYDDEYYEMELQGKYEAYKEILASAIILPVEKSWDKLFPCSWNSINRENIKNGVIIQPKQ
jgi:hypothetical protein